MGINVFMPPQLVTILVPCRLKQLEIVHSQCRDAEAFFHSATDDVGAVWGEQMAAAAIDLWEQRGIIEGCDVFQRDEFHGLAVLGLS